MLWLVWGILIGFALFVLISKIWCFWSRSKVCLIGKTALVTGGVSGIGYQLALGLASKGCRVIIADVIDTSESVERVIKETHNPNITGKRVDLASFKSVRKFAQDILATEERLNILLCNAGIGEYWTYAESEDGLQKTMQVNYFSHFLLTHLLLDLLKKSAPSRIVFTSSALAYTSNMGIDTLNPKPEYFSTWISKLTGGCYSNSKLAMAAAARVFGEKLKGTNVTVNAVHCSGVRTQIFLKGFTADPNIVTILFAALVFIYGKTPEQGAQTLLHVAQSNEVEKITGESFYEGMRVCRPIQIKSREFCQEIWDKSIKLTKLESNEIKC